VTNASPELLTVQEVADLYRVHPGTVRRWVRDEMVTAVRTPGRGIRVRRVEVERLLAPEPTEAAS